MSFEKTWLRIENASSVIITCVVLFNICQIAGDDYVDHENILETIIAQEQRARTGHKGEKMTSV